jgi:hypothetical protein
MQFTTICPRFHHQKTHYVAPEIPEIQAGDPNKTKEKSVTHHNSPQRPKFDFSHSQLVCPLLLTLRHLRKAYDEFAPHPAFDPRALK